MSESKYEIMFLKLQDFFSNDHILKHQAVSQKFAFKKKKKKQETTLFNELRLLDIQNTASVDSFSVSTTL